MEILHRTLFSRTSFGDEGVAVVPGLEEGLRLGWGEIEFVCITPTMERGEQGWQEKYNSLLPAGFASTFATRGELELCFVVRDRRPVVARAKGFWNRTRVRGALKPMVDAHDRRKPDQSLLLMRIRKSHLNHSVDDLLDLLSRHCRFDLVVFGW
jgi:hypothetical protein